MRQEPGEPPRSQPTRRRDSTRRSLTRECLRQCIAHSRHLPRQNAVVAELDAARHRYTERHQCGRDVLATLRVNKEEEVSATTCTQELAAQRAVPFRENVNRVQVRFRNAVCKILLRVPCLV